MKKHGILLVLAVSVLLTGGCVIPYKFTVRQGVTGIIVEDGGLRPISGATVTVVSRGMAESTVTDSNGRFLVPGASEWGIHIVPMDYAGIQWSMRIVAVGYRDHEVRRLFAPISSKVCDLDVISLKKGEPNQSLEPTPTAVTPRAGGRNHE